MRSHSYLNTTKEIIRSYDGRMPLAAWLKQFFRENKKFGSTDRKQVTHACYCYYRLGESFAGHDVEEKILVGLFLCSQQENIFLKELKPEWNEKVHLRLEEKVSLFPAFAYRDIFFSFNDELSEAIDKDFFSRSFLIQPDLFLRIRPGNREKVSTRLHAAGIVFELLTERLSPACQSKQT